MYQEKTNEQLINALQEGDEGAFAYIYEQHHQAVFKNILRRLPNQQEAEDILQEVFIALWQQKHQFSENHSIAGWLFTTSYYKSIAQLKKGLAISIRELKAADAEKRAEAHDHQENEAEYERRVTLVTTAIEQLPAQKRMAFKLYKLEGKTYEETASILTVSVDTAKEYVKSASKLLRQSVSSSQIATTVSRLIAFSILLDN